MHSSSGRKKSAGHQFIFLSSGKRLSSTQQKTIRKQHGYTDLSLMGRWGNHFRNKSTDSLEVGNIFDWTSFYLKGLSRHAHTCISASHKVIFLIGRLSANQKDVNPFQQADFRKRKKSSMEFQILKEKQSTRTRTCRVHSGLSSKSVSSCFYGVPQT